MTTLIYIIYRGTQDRISDDGGETLFNQRYSTPMALSDTSPGPSFLDSGGGLSDPHRPRKDIGSHSGNLRVEGRGQFGTLLSSGTVIKLTLTHSLCQCS